MIHYLLKLNKLIVFLSIIMVMIAGFQSCTSDPDELGFQVIPPNDELFVSFDTSLSFSGFTFYDDSIRSDEDVFSSTAGYSLLGSYVDEVFGFSKASFMTQLYLSTSNLNFGENLIVDSLVMYLKIAGVYGAERQTNQEIEVYRLTDSLCRDSNYYSNLNPEDFYNHFEMVGSGTYHSSGDTVVKVFLNPQILSVLYADTSVLEDNETFLKHFYGFYVTSKSVRYGGEIVYIDLMNYVSRVTLYYHNSTSYHPVFGDASKLKDYEYSFSSEGARVNLFQHDYSMSSNPIALNDSLADNSLLYIQAMAGTKAKIYLNDLKNWIDSIRFNSSTGDSDKIAINQAKLVLSVYDDYTTFPEYSPNTKLSLIAMNKNGEYESIADQVLGTNYYGGIYNSTTKTYTFNISLHLQRLIDGEIDDFQCYILLPSENRSSANRVVIDNGKTSNSIKLQMTYIKY